jgi:tetratricopeptide (TPR) repeat protein
MDSDKLVSVLENLGIDLFVQEKYKDAEEFHARAVDVCRKSQKISERNLAAALQGQASFFLKLTRLEDAERTNLEALELVEEACGEGDPKLAPFLAFRANILRQTNREAQALEIDKRIKALWKGTWL